MKQENRDRDLFDEIDELISLACPWIIFAVALYITGHIVAALDRLQQIGGW